MICLKLEPIKIGEAEYTPYTCQLDSDAFDRLVIILSHLNSYTYDNGVITITRPPLMQYISKLEEKEVIRLKKYRRRRRLGGLTKEALIEVLNKAAEEERSIREYFLLGAVMQVLTPEPRVFELMFNAAVASTLDWLTLGRQAVKLVDSIVAMHGYEKASIVLNRLVSCVAREMLSAAMEQ